MDYINLEKAVPFGKNLTVKTIPFKNGKYDVGDWETIVRTPELLNAVKEATVSDILLTNEFGDTFNLSEMTNIDNFLFPMSKSAKVVLTRNDSKFVVVPSFEINVVNFAGRPADSIFISADAGPIVDTTAIANNYAKLTKFKGEQFKLGFTEPKANTNISFEYHLDWDCIQDESSLGNIFNGFNQIPMLRDVSQPNKDTVRAFAFDNELLISVTEVSKSHYKLFANLDMFGDFEQDCDSDTEIIKKVKDILRTFKNYLSEKERLERYFK